MTPLTAPVLMVVVTLLACGSPGTGSTNSTASSEDQIYYNVEYNKTNGNIQESEYTFSIKHGSKVGLECVVDSHQNISVVTWYRRVDNSSHGIPLSSDFWDFKQHLQVDEYTDKSNATISEFTQYFEGNYYCTAIGNGYSLVGTSDINLKHLPTPIATAKPGMNDDVSNSTCQLPKVSDIDASQDTVRGVLNETAYVNVTLNWRYVPEAMDKWYDTGDFAVRFATWDSTVSLPEKTNEANAYMSYDYNWEPWIVVPRGSRSLILPFLDQDLYYLFQVAVPKVDLNPHNVWYSDNSCRYSSGAYYFNDQRGVTIDEFPVTFFNVSEGTQVNLSCIARGMPKPRVVWLREVPGTQNDGYASTTNLYTIKDARISDSGTYICSAQNTLLLASKTETKIESQSVTLVVHQRAPESGQCFEAKPRACEKYLHANATVWSGSELELDTASRLAANLQNLSKQSNVEAQCAERILELFCKWSVPVCSENDTRAQVCQSSCLAVVNECASLWPEARGTIKELEAWDDCYDLLDTDGCVAVSSGQQTSPTPAGGTVETDAQVIGVIVGVAALLALVVALVIAVCCYCRHASPNKFTSLSDLPTLDIERASSIRMSLSENPYYQRRRFVSISEKDLERLHQIGKDEITYISELGQGNFGRVFKGEVRGIVPDQDVTTVAVKNLLEEDNEAAVKAFLHEAKIMSRFDHPSIVKLLAVSITTSPFYLVFEFMSEGDLNEYLHQKASSQQKRTMNSSPLRSRTESALSNEPSELSCEQLLHISHQIAEGMKYLADNNHVHRDLATRNCLVGEKLVVKIGDFGMSQHLYHNDYYRVHGEAALPVRWMPPESIVYGTFTTETDVWSFGVVMWEVFSFAMQPYFGKSNEEVCDLVRKGANLDCPDSCPAEVYNLMQSCWSLTSNNRPSFKDLCVKLSHLSQGKVDSPSMPRDTQSLSSQDSTVFASSPAPSPSLVDTAYHPSDDSDMEA